MCTFGLSENTPHWHAPGGNCYSCNNFLIHLCLFVKMVKRFFLWFCPLFVTLWRAVFFMKTLNADLHVHVAKLNFAR